MKRGRVLVHPSDEASAHRLLAAAMTRPDRSTSTPLEYSSKVQQPTTSNVT
jgi:hypothetical protein